MKFKLEIDMGNAAFEGCQSVNEIQRILVVVADSIDWRNTLKIGDKGKTIDSNGNKVGQWEITK